MDKKIVMFDLETTSLFGSIGSIVSIGIFDPKNFKEPFIYFVSKPEEEAKALEWFHDQILKNGYQAVCGWNIKNFDIPFLIARAVKLNFDFSDIVKIEQMDLLEIARKIFKLHSFKLEDVCKWLKIDFNTKVKAYMIDEFYHKNLSGDKNAEERIKEKCKADLMALAGLFEKMKPYFNLITTKRWAFS